MLEQHPTVEDGNTQWAQGAVRTAELTSAPGRLQGNLGLRWDICTSELSGVLSQLIKNQIFWESHTNVAGTHTHSWAQSVTTGQFYSINLLLKSQFWRKQSRLQPVHSFLSTQRPGTGTWIWIHPCTAITVFSSAVISDSHLTPNTAGFYTLLVWNSYKSLARARWTVPGRKAALSHTAWENHPGNQPSSSRLTPDSSDYSSSALKCCKHRSKNRFVPCLELHTIFHSALIEVCTAQHWKPPSQTPRITVINTLASCHEGSGFETVPKRILKGEKAKCTPTCAASNGYLLEIKNTYC